MKKISSEEKNDREATILTLDVPPPPFDVEDDLCARAAWLYYGAGLTQGEVAKRLNVPSVKAHRLVARANRLGLVRVSIDAPVASCMQLEDELQRKYGLRECVVAPEIDDDPLPLRTLGLAGGRYLRLAIESGTHAAIGVGHGRTLAACVCMLPRMDVPELKLVSLLGGMTRRYVTTPFDVIHRLAERTNAAAYVLPLPFFANTAVDKTVFLEQRGVADVFELGINATLRFVGVGTLGDDASILSTGLVEKEEFDEARRLGAVGELLGHMFSARGKLIDSGISARALSMSAPDIARRATVAVAGGLSKIDAIRAVLGSDLLHGLITDERTARILAN
jgi:DNA-binding transcriptional regulator LsrR (DeoR family)